jgi:hypothetical protein
VLEAAGRLRRRTAAEDEFGRDQLVEGVTELILGPVGNSGEQRVGELPAECGTDLRDLFHGREVVEAREQRIVQSQLAKPRKFRT